LLGIGTSACRPTSARMQVTGHNIANVGTDGYSRQQLDLTTRIPQQAGFGSLGTGVQPANVTRVMNEFVERSLATNLSGAAYHDTMARLAGSLDNLLGDADAGLMPALTSFFAAAEDVATDPTSTAARQQLLTEAQMLTDRFAQMERAISDQRDMTNGQIRASVEEINELASGISRLNQEIVESMGRNNGRDPNDLLDRRDTLVRELSGLVGVETVKQSDGSINVFIGQGQPLVVGTQPNQLYAQAMGADPDRIDISFRTQNSMVVITDFLSGGKLGASLDARDDMLDPASNNLGRMALSIAETVNAVHRQGMTLDGALGGDLFRVPDLRVQSAGGNAASGAPVLTVDDVGGLRASDYDLRFDGDNWLLSRRSDGQHLATIAPGDSFSFDGLHLDLAGVAGEANGDRFTLQPMRVSGELSLATNDPRDVAAASPIAIEAGSGNSGGVQVRSLSIIDPTDPDLRSPVAIEFDGTDYQVDGMAFPLDPSGDTRIDYNGWSLVLRGTPQAGDQFSLADNAGAVGDNSNMLALADLRNTRTMSGGNATFGEAYGELVADVGIKSQRARLNADVHQRQADEARAQRESISGVNLDEEAANLIKFQQAYQAAAQVIAVSGQMFDSLLAAVRR
jgi:flagellar hook-associated protein 1